MRALHALADLVLLSSGRRTNNCQWWAEATQEHISCSEYMSTSAEMHPSKPVYNQQLLCQGHCRGSTEACTVAQITAAPCYQRRCATEDLAAALPSP